ncbi:MAG TPA: proton-conducting transporter membrane subunit [Bacillota bacterium]|nr:proton-conducting transporter membrane subunit [Bacillota bacterium]
MLLAYIFVPLFGAVLMPFLRKLWSKGTTAVAIAVTSYQIIITAWLAYQNFVPNKLGLEVERWMVGQRFSLKVDGLTMVALLTIGLVSLVTVLFSTRYPLDEDRRPGYNGLILLAVTGMNAMALATDIFSLYIFLEVVSISSFILISYQMDEGAMAAFKYMMLSAVATIFLLAGIALLFTLTGSVSFTEMAARVQSGDPLVKFSLAFIFFAFALKAGTMPFHGWLPDAYTLSPAPVSIFLAGIVTKIAGVYTMMRIILDVFSFSKSFTMMLLIFGAVSTVLGAFMALGQKDFKRMLAFSSISQIGLIMMGFAVGPPLGLIGAVFHFFNHATFKSLLFLNSGAVEMATGTRDFDKLGGLANRMPVTGVTSVIGLLSTAGVPPLAGFWSKLLIIIALWVSGYHIFAGIAIFASIVTLAYLLALQRGVFYGKIRPGLENIQEVAPFFYWPAIIMAAITILSGIFFPLIYYKLLQPISLLVNLLFK